VERAEQASPDALYEVAPVYEILTAQGQKIAAVGALRN
jgi:hypothetical protein